MKILQIGDVGAEICAECWARDFTAPLVKADVIVADTLRDGQYTEYGLCANHAEVADIDAEDQKEL